MALEFRLGAEQLPFQRRIFGLARCAPYQLDQLLMHLDFMIDVGAIKVRPCLAPKRSHRVVVIVH
jgi:hypothetical protein